MSAVRVSLVQPNFQVGPTDFNAYYLPYSVGCLWAYAISQPSLQNKIVLNEIIWKRDLIDRVVEICRDDDIVAFSTYVWNANYNYELAKKLKQANPKILTVFGGPEPPVAQKDIFIEYPWIDICVRGEGEITFARILEEFSSGKRWKDIPGLLINENGQAVETEKNPRVRDLEEMPSPYLLGVFDDIIKKYPEYQWNATLETNRGCPYQCTFCDWGSLTYSKVKKFNLEKVFAELEWIGQHANYVSFADANLGMFVERDGLIIDKFIEVSKRWGKIQGYNANWAKNQKQDVLHIVKKLVTELPGMGQGLTVSTQSMDDQVLTIIKRRNLGEHLIEDIFSMCEDLQVPVYTELILGLPGETVESWKRSVFKVIRAGNHFGIHFNHAHLLNNSEMNLVQKQIYDIETTKISDGWPECENKILEFLDMVKSTSTMKPQDFMEIYAWNSFINALHISGMTSYASRFLARANLMTYEEFYTGLYEHFQSVPWMNEKFNDIKKGYTNWANTGSIDLPLVEDVLFHGHIFPSRLLAVLHSENLIEDLFDEVDIWLRSTTDLDVDLIGELIDFTKTHVYTYDSMTEYPIKKSYQFDFIGYVRHGHDYKNPCEIEFSIKEKKPESRKLFTELLYFARKRNFGKTLISVSRRDMMEK